jgi:hypothetical protein
MFSNVFRKSYRLWDDIEKYGGAREALHADKVSLHARSHTHAPTLPRTYTHARTSTQTYVHVPARERAHT